MLTLRTLGGLAVLDADGRPLAGAAAQRRRLAVLALLARGGERGISRDKVMAMLWPDVDEERARRTFNQALYALRRDLGHDDAIAGQQELRLDRAHVRSDLATFEAACAAGDHAAAVEAYGGPFLDGFHLPEAGEFERWIETERGLLAHRHAQALQALAAQATDRGDHVAASGWWRRLAATDPLSGRVALGLMRALVAAGDRHGAIQHARVHAALLAQELDVTPDPDILDFAERLRQEPAGTSATALTTAERPIPAHLVTPRPTPAEPATAAPTAPTPPVAVAPATRPARRRLRLLLLGGMLLLAAAAGLRALWPAAVGPVPGRTERVTIADALELDPAISPDGRMVAFASGPAGNTRIHVRMLAGGQEHSISDAVPGPHRLPAWSPDGQTIVFQARRAIYAVPALGGAPELMVPDDSARGRPTTPSWSPDGRWIAYTRGTRVIMRSLPSGKERTLATMSDPHSPVWSPDGTRLAFVNGNGAFVLGAQAPAVSATNIGNIAPSTLYVIPTWGTAEPVAVTSGEHLAVSPTWAPDSKHLLYLSDADGARDVWVRRIDGEHHPVGDARRLTTGLGAHGIALSADGQHLVYSALEYVNNVFRTTITAGSTSVSEAVAVTTGNQAVEGLGLSRDGRTLAFDSDRGGTQDIWRIPVDGGEARRVSSTVWHDFLPAWSPGGDEIAFYAFRQGVRRLLIVPAEGGNTQLVTADSVDERYPSWSPDGTRLLYSRWNGTRYDLYAVTRGAAGRWASPVLIAEGGEGGRWAPDGAHVLFFHARDADLLVAEADGRNATRVYHGDGTSSAPFPALAEWGPDSRTIFFSAADTGGVKSIRRLALDGGAVREVLRFDDPARPSNRPEFATDGRRLYFTVGRPGSDLWLLTLEGRW